MNIFEFRDRLVEDYSNYVNSFIQIRDPKIRNYVDKSLNSGTLWPEPLIQLNPSFEQGDSINDLVATGILHPECARIFRVNKKADNDGDSLILRKHQSDAVQVAKTGSNYVLTTGTASGKSLAYIVPIVDYALRQQSKNSIKAIIVYPMNALANSQFGELEKFLCLGYPKDKPPVTFARYTGQENDEQREKIIQNPPDIILTNYVMLELILTRPYEKKLIEAAQGLRFIVLDELHTYRGRQGADVALLVRRVRERLSADHLQCIGTSATIAGRGSFEEQRAEVAEVASQLFGTDVKPNNIIGETLRRATPARDLNNLEYIRALAARIKDLNDESTRDHEAYINDPLSIWLESTFGLAIEEGSGRLIRTTPRTISGGDGAAHDLHKLTSVSLDNCIRAIQQGLLGAYLCQPNPETSSPPFAFRLHQFISRGDTIYTTLETEENRYLTVYGQQFKPGSRSHILLPLVFCRECGQEYFCVRLNTDSHTGVKRYQPRTLSDSSSDDAGKAGFLYINTEHPWPSDEQMAHDRLPDDWLEEFQGKARVRPNRKDSLPRAVLVGTDGVEVNEGLACHYIASPFRFCLQCGVSYGFRQTDDFSKLTSLGSEGRSTATTILSLSAITHLRHIEGLMDIAKKLLSFTDNRQDASLQAGHFNDFVEIAMLRSAIYRAVSNAGLVDYKNLRSEELGSVYEALLELHPYFDTEAGAFELQTASGNERKTTGSYYTPGSLVQCLLDSALNPVIEEAAKKANPEAAILDLKVCDPACGSGHFLIAAAHRIAKRLAAIRTGDEEPAPDALRKALRDVIGNCIYGIDINPMAAELCKVSLWMEALEPGKPLSFLDHRIQVGNSLLGATPALLEKGILDDVFKPIEGDDKAVCAKFKKLNKEDRLGVQRLFKETTYPWERLGDMVTALIQLDSIPDDDIKGVRQKEKWYEDYIHSGNYLFTKFWADTWCAAFVWKKTETFGYPITEEVFRRIEHNPHSVEKWMRDEIIRLAKQYQFVHWHLAFPNVFGVAKSVEEAENQQAGWHGGFDVVGGNPPWERIKLQEKEWFAQRRPDIANAPNAAARGRMIRALKDEDPALLNAFLEDRRKAEGESHFVRSSGRYPLCGRGDINTYAVFAETNRMIINSTGRIGFISPSGIATDDTTKYFFADLMESQSLVSLYDFENRDGIFPRVHRSYRFCLLTLSSTPVEGGGDFVFYAYRVEALREVERHFTLTAQDLALLNPNTHTCPLFRTKRDAELTKAIYGRVPVLIHEGATNGNPWDAYYMRFIDMSDHSELLRFSFTTPVPDWDIPLYEAKLFWAFDHRYSTFENAHKENYFAGQPIELTTNDKKNARLTVKPRYYVPRELFQTLLAKYPDFEHSWLLVWRDVTNSTNERTCVSTIIPLVASTRKCPALGFQSKLFGALLVANLNAFIFDYVTRQNIGGLSLSFFILKQLPVLPPSTYSEPCEWIIGQTLYQWIAPRVLELIYTAYDLEGFAADCGYEDEPFVWDEARRFLLRCELDAAYFHLYGIRREDVEYIMETFPIVKRRDEQVRGEYRTKRAILEIYDAIQRAIESGESYQTRLDPPPADPSMAHPAPIEIHPLVLPAGKRYPLNDDEGYAMLVILTMLYEEGGSIDTQRLMNAYSLLTMPDLLEEYGASVEGDVAHAWRDRYCDELKKEPFQPVLRDLVSRGAIKLVRQDDGSTTFWVDRSGFELDSDIQFDVRFTLKISDSLPEEKKKYIPEVATLTDIALLYSATG